MFVGPYLDLSQEKEGPGVDAQLIGQRGLLSSSPLQTQTRDEPRT